MQLLKHYGEVICSVVIKRYKIRVYKIFDFYVEVVKDLLTKKLLRADPVSHIIVQLYQSYLL